MGKDLKGKELGIGISQRKDGLYTARLTRRNGKRAQKYFKKLRECKAWIAEESYREQHGSINAINDLTVEAWFRYWIEEIKQNNIRASTKNRYELWFRAHIQPKLGDMLVSEVMPIHCQRVLNVMAQSGKKNTYIKSIRLILHMLFQSAEDNGIIHTNPVNRQVRCINGAASCKREALTVEEQKRLLAALQDTPIELLCRFILQTGLRIGEANALEWGDVDLEGRVAHITKSIDYLLNEKEWRVGKPKSKSGVRDVPLTEEAVSVLLKQKERNERNLARLGNQVTPPGMEDYIFLNERGVPTYATSCDGLLKTYCKAAGIPRISMHILRHTFATRCIEGGMKPKTLQKILGHSSLSMTMDLYVHVTEDEKMKEMESIQSYIKLV